MNSDKSIMPVANAVNGTPAPKSIFQITQDFLFLTYHLEEAGGELDKETEELLTLNKENFKDKAEQYGHVIRHMEAEEKLLADEIDRLNTHLARKVAARKRLEKRLIDASTMLDITEVRGKYIDLFFRPSKFVQITDDSLIPEEYLIVKDPETSISKAMIKKAIEAGKAVPGAELKTNKNLTIR